MKCLAKSWVFIAIAAAVAQADLTTGLKGYWPLDDGQGAVVTDVTPFGNNGAIRTGSSNPQWTAGINAQCLNFDGNDDSVVIENQSFFNFYDKITVAVWVKGSFVHGWQAFASKGGESSGWQIRRHSDSSNAGFTMRGLSLGDLQGKAIIIDGQWHLVAATYDSSTGVDSIYVDGVLDVEYTQNGTANPSPEPIVFGAANFGGLALGNYHSGLLDDIAIWNRALSGSDIAELYNNGTPQDVIYWRWNAANPSPADDAEDVAFSGPVSLSWSLGTGAPAPVTKQVLFYGTDKVSVASSLASATIGDTAAVVLGASDTGYSINVISDKSYYWRVASVMGTDASDPNMIAQGSTWTFTTAQTVPSFTGQPGFAFAAAGESVTFDTTALFADSCRWYKTDPNETVALTDGAKYSGTGTDSLTINDVQSADEQYSYYCLIANAAGQAQSENAGLRIKELLAHWPLNGTTQEATDPALTGVITGDISWVSSEKLGTVAAFDAGEYITIPANSAFELYDAITVSCFVRNPGSSNWESFVSKNGENGEGWMLRQRDGSGAAVFSVRGTDGNDDPEGVARVDDGRWHQVVGVYDSYAGLKSLYVDGKFDNSTGDGGLIATTTQPIMFGRTPADWANFFSGEMAEVQIFNYPLNADEVAELYYQTLGEPFCMTAPEYDLNGDCQVNLGDLSLIAVDWLNCGLYPNCE